VTLWLPHVEGVPTQTPAKHVSLCVKASKSVHVVPLADMKKSGHFYFIETRLRKTLKVAESRTLLYAK
jgi:hypothetical protein